MQVAVGRISRAHGIRGDVFVDVKTDDPGDRFAAGSVLVTDPAGRGPLTIISATPHGRGWRICFDGVDDRNAAEQLRGTMLVIDSDELPPTGDPDLFHDAELVGLDAVGTDGDPLGEVTDVLHGAGGDSLVVSRLGGGETLIPFVRAIVVQVDVGAGRVVIDAPPGLLEL